MDAAEQRLKLNPVISEVNKDLAFFDVTLFCAEDWAERWITHRHSKSKELMSNLVSIKLTKQARRNNSTVTLCKSQAAALLSDAWMKKLERSFGR